MNNKIYKALDISMYIIYYTNSTNNAISNLRLQQALYFTQVAFIVEKNMPCFEEEFQAWDCGAVIPQIYNEFATYGINNIPTIIEYTDFSTGILNATKKKVTDNIITLSDKKIINKIVDTLNNYSTIEIIKIIHNQATWQNAYIRGFHNVITKKSIKDFFTN